MPLPLLNLDDRRWADLVDEGRALIPRYSPVWTDFNVHDPGIMLMELFAWFTEARVHQLNEVLDRQRWKFLSLIGYHAHGPRASRTVMVFGGLSGGTSIDLPAGVELDAGPFVFTTVRDIHLASVTLSALQVDDGGGVLRSFSRDLRAGIPIRALGTNPPPGAALYLGFDEIPTSSPVALAFRFAGPGNDHGERERIEREAKCERKACQKVKPGWSCPGAATPPHKPVLHPPPHHSARIVWEAFAGGSWTPLTQVADDTRSLTLDGVVEVNLPAGISETTLGAESLPYFYVRARLQSGGYDAPVVLNDVRPNAVEVRQHIPILSKVAIAAGVAPTGTAPAPGDKAYMRFTVNVEGVITALAFMAAGTAGIPGIRMFAYKPPAAGVAGWVTLECAVLGPGSGAPSQQLRLPVAPVEDHVDVYTHDGTKWDEWRHHDDFDAAHRANRVVTLDPVAGLVEGGSGERGEVFPFGDAVVVMARSTAGRAGDVFAGSKVKLSTTVRNKVLLSGVTALQIIELNNAVSSPYDAVDGLDRETLAETAAAAAGLLHAHERLESLAEFYRTETLDQIPKAEVLAIPAPTNAVNTRDIERVALSVPGTRIARARAWRNTSALFPCLDAPGTVTVVILPDMPVAQPQPTAGLKTAVFRALDLRRTICTRVEVTGPHYVVVSVRATLALVAGADRKATVAAVIAALDAFFDPRTGGPLGLGWPFGRDVYRAEVLEKVASVPGVDYATDLRLTADGGAAQCGDLAICDTWLVAPGTHSIEVLP